MHGRPRRHWTTGTARCVVAVAALAAVAALPATAGAVTLADGDIVIDDNDGTLNHRIVKLDPVTGVLTPIVTLPINVKGLVVDLDGDVWVTGFGSGGRLIRVDPETQTWTNVSTGGLLTDPQDVAVEPSGALIVTNNGATAVVRVTPGSPQATQTALTANEPLVAGNLNGPSGVTTTRTGRIIVANRNTAERGVGQVDPVSGDYTSIAAGNATFVQPAGVDTEADGDILVADANSISPGIVRVDALTATTTKTASTGGPFDVGAEPGGSYVYTSSSGLGRVFRRNTDGTTTALVTDFQISPITLDIADVNNPPQAADDRQYVTTGDGSLTVPAADGVLANDLDADEDPLTAVEVTPAANGTVQVAADGGFTYTPVTGFRGTDTFTYRASDGRATSEPAVVTVRVNSAPMVSSDAYDAVGGQTLTVPAPGVLANDSDPDGESLTVRFDELDGFQGQADGSFTYTPALLQSGGTSVRYCATDGTAETCGIVTFTVTPGNRAPTATGDAYTVGEGSTLTVPAPGVLGNDGDPDGDPLTALVADPPAAGALDLAADGSLVYTPAPGFSGTDTFTYRASDGHLESGAATVTVTVTPAPGVRIADAETLEGTRGATDLVFTLTRPASTATDRTVVTWTTRAVTATARDDFRERSGRVTFRIGETTATLEVPVLGDRVDEPDETFEVLLTSSTGTPIVDGTAVGTIRDDD